METWSPMLMMSPWKVRRFNLPRIPQLIMPLAVSTVKKPD